MSSLYKEKMLLVIAQMAQRPAKEQFFKNLQSSSVHIQKYHLLLVQLQAVI